MTPAAVTGLTLSGENTLAGPASSYIPAVSEVTEDLAASASGPSLSPEQDDGSGGFEMNTMIMVAATAVLASVIAVGAVFILRKP